jgi:hypothetical protein
MGHGLMGMSHKDLDLGFRNAILYIPKKIVGKSERPEVRCLTRATC